MTKMLVGYTILLALAVAFMECAAHVIFGNNNINIDANVVFRLMFFVGLVVVSILATALIVSGEKEIREDERNKQ